ncbi:MAG: amino acid ABC transporter ATP-binding protein [Planctomycetaceae bacterium]|nr:amino acid ABC transporter ATP-binding protein [Planctomycetales bacterium]MCB9875751.1 amino acid ABC transporter ATP-binding protein [Planctomycetaceae bacterium]MCB9936888.1 amino acid ABC transporter ATP-binding protein [Planctomycetaceae bacterium]HRX81685.1 amino acid ABC transporter ATP-binding protein [Pirellulaceae bacterium]
MIELTKIVKRYQEHEVLRGVSLTVDDGEVCVLLGPSGGGKSTLLRTINGLETFDSGKIRVGDVTLPATPGPERDKSLAIIRQRVGMVFQQFNLFPHRTVLQNVTEAPIHVLKQPRDVAVATARRLLERVGMLEKQDARPGSLSGGQQQRVAIARTLAMSPEAILFDEPTSALDPRTTAEVISVMTDLAAAGQRMIVVTHAMSFARTVAHQVHILHAGTIAESGPPLQIFEAPQTDITRSFLSEAAIA